MLRKSKHWRDTQSGVLSTVYQQSKADLHKKKGLTTTLNMATI